MEVLHVETWARNILFQQHANDMIEVLMMSIMQTMAITIYMVMAMVIMIIKAPVSLFVAQEMLSASISQTRILQTCGVPHPNMVSGANSLQGNDQIDTLHTHTYTQSFPLMVCS